MFLEPAAPTATPAAVQAILEADVVLLGPGSLFTSVIPNLLVPGIQGAVNRSRALKIYIGNLMTQPGETDGFTASDHLSVVMDYLGGKPDLYLCNDAIPRRLERHYRQEGQIPVRPDHKKIQSLGVRTLYADLMMEHDRVRHDPARLANAIYLEALKHKENQELKETTGIDADWLRRMFAIVSMDSMLQEMFDEEEAAKRDTPSEPDEDDAPQPSSPSTSGHTPQGLL